MIKKNTRILLVPCGGTICTSVKVNEDGVKVLVIEGDGPLYINEKYQEFESKFAGTVQIVETENLCVLSENMTVEKWNELLKSIRTCDNDSFDGIIIAHGTDTLAYSASLLSLMLKNLGKPVFLVSSGLTPSDARTNAHDNFRTAVELICCGITPNVYVPYRNDYEDGTSRMYLHLGSRLLQCRPYDSNFYSRGALEIIGEINEETVEKLCEQLPPVQKTDFDERISINRGFELSNCVLNITPYVGLDYSAYDYGKFSAILHGTYHSGTVCENSSSSDSIRYLLETVKGECDVYIAPSDLCDTIYESTDHLAEYVREHGGAEFMYGSTEEMYYAKLLVAYSIKEFGRGEIKEFLMTDVAGEMVAG